MPVSRNSLSEYYRRLSNDELSRMLNSGELTALAQDVARTELKNRGIILNLKSEHTVGIPNGLKQADANQAFGDLVLLVEIRGIVEAELLRGRLSAEGINAIIVDSPMIRPLTGGISRILVPETQLEQAQRVLHIIESESRRDDGRRPAPTNAGPMVILVFLGMIMLIVGIAFLLPRRDDPVHSRPNWGFRSDWNCSNTSLDPICFQHTPRHARP